MAIEYMSHIDQLTWTKYASGYNVYECDIPWEERPKIISWINSSCEGTVVIWNGTYSPKRGSQNWDLAISPLSKCYLIFENHNDQIKFMLEFRGPSYGLCVDVHKSLDVVYRKLSS